MLKLIAPLRFIFVLRAIRSTQLLTAPILPKITRGVTTYTIMPVQIKLGITSVVAYEKWIIQMYSYYSSYCYTALVQLQGKSLALDSELRRGGYRQSLN